MTPGVAFGMDVVTAIIVCMDHLVVVAVHTRRYV